MSSDGKLNCAPYSYFSAIAHDPPMLAIGICNTDLRKDITDRKKDTLVNIEETRSYVVNIMSEWYVNAANHTCGPYTPDVNEVELSGLTTVPSVKVKAPRIAEAAVQMECELHHVEKIYNDKGEHTTSLVLGRVVRFHVHDDVVEYGSGKEDRPLVSIEKLKPLGRVGGVRYTTIGDAFDLARPTK